MDGICSAVLNKIYALGAPGRYFIISEDEFFEIFPEGSKQDTAELKKALKALTDSGYTDIRYSGNGMYCVALLKLPPAPEPESQTPPPPPQIEQKTEYRYTFKAAFIGGAIGGAIGGVITSLISLLFLLC